MNLYTAIGAAIAILLVAAWIYGKYQWDTTKTKPYALVLFAVTCFLAAGLAWQVWENRSRAEIIAIMRDGLTNDARSQFRLGLAFEGGSKYLKRDVERAAVFYRRAAEQGYAPAQYRIGLFHKIGRGVPKHFATALAWFKKAAAKNHPKALTQLGNFLIEGKGMLADKVAGKALLTKAAQLGDPWAFSSLLVLASDESRWHPDSEQRIELYKLSVLAKRAGLNRPFLRLDIRDKMTRQEIAEAEKRIRVWERVSKRQRPHPS